MNFHENTTSVWKVTGAVRGGGLYDPVSTLLVADSFAIAAELAPEALAYGWGLGAETTEVREVTRLHETVRLQVGRVVTGEDL